MAFDTTLDALQELLDGVVPGVDGIVLVEEIGRLVDAARVRAVSSMPSCAPDGIATP